MHVNILVLGNTFHVFSNLKHNNNKNRTKIACKNSFLCTLYKRLNLHFPRILIHLESVQINCCKKNLAEGGGSHLANIDKRKKKKRISAEHSSIPGIMANSQPFFHVNIRDIKTKTQIENEIVKCKTFLEGKKLTGDKCKFVENA